jgi:hypothetical protein
MPKPLSELGDPGSTNLAQLHRWAHSRGGIDAYWTLIRLVVQGRSSTPVVLQALQVEVVSGEPPSGRTLVKFQPVAGGIPVRTLNVELDRTPPTVQFEEGPGFPLRVSSGELEVIDLLAHTASCTCRWVATLHFTADGESDSVTIDDHGQPFETRVPKNGYEVGFCNEGVPCRF